MSDNAGKYKDLNIEDFEIVRDRLLKERYEEKLKSFRKLLTCYHYGIIKETDEEFIDLQGWLRDNFSMSYLDLL